MKTQKTRKTAPTSQPNRKARRGKRSLTIRTSLRAGNWGSVNEPTSPDFDGNF